MLPHWVLNSWALVTLLPCPVHANMQQFLLLLSLLLNSPGSGTSLSFLLLHYCLSLGYL
jgi:hypothetical protein